MHQGVAYAPHAKRELSLRIDLGEALEVEGTAQVHAELAGFARDVGPCVPRVGEGIERCVGEVGDLLIPNLLSLSSRLNGT